ncbi:DUF58 domain-containing protein [Alteribacter aurantiacus]|uniref:DUF58 domain-containing protein n=1 Tax=Alteribacter aurantiacus TaxID=254410 RepID=UPI0004231C47|nr:DUF58 domain-containing protein [Alteribacter aurantiacus]
MNNQWTTDFNFAKSFTVLLATVPFLFLLAVITGDMLLIGLAVFFTFFVYVNKWYLTYIASHLFIPHDVQEVRMYPGDQDTLYIPFENRGRIPIFNGSWGYYLYDHEESVEVVSKKDPSSYTLPLHVPSGKRRFFKTEIKAVKRGTSQVRSIEVVLYDAFRLSSVRMTYQSSFRGEVIVYPEPTATNGLDQQLETMKGNHTKPHSLYEEMTMTRGSRDYRPGDPFNRINWKTTAKSAALQTNIYEKVTLAKWTLVLNIRSGDSLVPTIPSLEDVLSDVAYTMIQATSQGITFELFINIKVPGSSTGFHLEDDTGKKHLMQGLEILARLRHGQLTINEELMLKRLFHHSFENPGAIIHFGHYGENDMRYYSEASKTGTSITIIAPRRGEKGGGQREKLAT